MSRIFIPCSECEMRMPIDVQNPGTIYTLTCPNGHVTQARVASDKSVLLYEAGIQALGDGYYREAVANFAACLERYLETSMHALLHAKNAGFNQDESAKVWKQLNRQSERQLGAFWMLYFACHGRAPTAFDKNFLLSHKLSFGTKSNDPIEFRNAVTHKGDFLTYNQAVTYGEAVLRYIVNITDNGIASFSGYAHYLGWYATAAPLYGIEKDTIALPLYQIETFMRIDSPREYSKMRDKSLFSLFPKKP